MAIRNVEGGNPEPFRWLDLASLLLDGYDAVVIVDPIRRDAWQHGSSPRMRCRRMHELGITQEIVSIVSEYARGAKVVRVVLEIGKLSAVLPDAVRFCFDLCGEGTPVEGAQLVIIETPGRARCRTCAQEFTLERPFGQCVCGNTDLEWLAGEELKIREVEVA